MKYIFRTIKIFKYEHDRKDKHPSGDVQYFESVQEQTKQSKSLNGDRMIFRKIPWTSQLKLQWTTSVT